MHLYRYAIFHNSWPVTRYLSYQLIHDSLPTISYVANCDILIQLSQRSKNPNHPIVGQSQQLPQTVPSSKQFAMQNDPSIPVYHWFACFLHGYVPVRKEFAIISYHISINVIKPIMINQPQNPHKWVRLNILKPSLSPNGRFMAVALPDKHI